MIPPLCSSLGGGIVRRIDRLSLAAPEQSSSARQGREGRDAQYLYEARYTAEGAKGLEKEGGVGRREAVKKHLAEIGGKLESMYFAFGDAIAT